MCSCCNSQMQSSSQPLHWGSRTKRKNTTRSAVNSTWLASTLIRGSSWVRFPLRKTWNVRQIYWRIWVPTWLTQSWSGWRTLMIKNFVWIRLVFSTKNLHRQSNLIVELPMTRMTTISDLMLRRKMTVTLKFITLQFSKLQKGRSTWWNTFLVTLNR